MTHKTINKKLDNIWSKIVKAKAHNRCEHCHTTKNLNSHHIFGRTIRSTRWDSENGVCLCVSCHTFGREFSAHQTPTEFTKWIINKRGEEWYNRLKEKTKIDIKRSPMSIKEKEELYKKLKEELSTVS